MDLSDISNAAKKAFADIEFPHRKDEYWRFANLKAWGVDGLLPFFASSQPPKGQPCQKARLIKEGLGGVALTLSDGRPGILKVPEGAQIMTMGQAYAANARRLQEFFMSATGKLDMFEATRAGDGVFVCVEEGASVELDMAVFSNAHISAAGAYFLLKKNSKLRLNKTSITFGGSLSSSRFGFELEEGASLEYAQAKFSDRAALMFEREDFYLGDSSSVVDAMSQEGLAHSRSERNFNILGRGVSLDSRAFIKASGDTVADLRTKQIHRVGSSKSNLAVKAALDDSSSLAFTGLVDVCEQAQKTQAYQSCRALLLNRDALAQASPILEICANDVECSHGCAVAEPDAEELFYMRQRGLPLDIAREMIVESFAATTFALLPDGLKLRAL